MTLTMMMKSLASWMKIKLFTVATTKEIGTRETRAPLVTTQRLSQSARDYIILSRKESSTVMNCPRCTRDSRSRRTWKSALSPQRYFKLFRDRSKEARLVTAQMSNHSIEMSNNFSRINNYGLSNSRLIVRWKKERLGISNS